MKEYIVEIKKVNGIIYIEAATSYDEAWQLARESFKDKEVNSVIVKGI